MKTLKTTKANAILLLLLPSIVLTSLLLGAPSTIVTIIALLLGALSCGRIRRVNTYEVY